MSHLSPTFSIFLFLSIYFRSLSQFLTHLFLSLSLTPLFLTHSVKLFTLSFWISSLYLTFFYLCYFFSLYLVLTAFFLSFFLSLFPFILSLSHAFISLSLSLTPLFFILSLSISSLCRTIFTLYLSESSLFNFYKHSSLSLSLFHHNNHYVLSCLFFITPWRKFSSETKISRAKVGDDNIRTWALMLRK